jgi:hypothetical protein
VWVSSHVKLVRDDAGEPQDFSLQLEDISERLQMQAPCSLRRRPTSRGLSSDPTSTRALLRARHNLALVAAGTAVRVRARRLRDSLGTATLIVLAVLVAADLFLIGLHLVHGFSRHGGRTGLFARSAGWGLDKDGGYAEQFAYLQIGALVMLLVARAVARRTWLAAGWAVTFAITLADDSLQLHERFGGRVVDWTGLHAAFGLRAQDFGELAVWGGLGLCIVVVLAASYRYSDDAERASLRPMLVIALGLGFLAVGVDMVHSVLRAWPMGPVLTIVEDGSELVLSSFALAYGVQLATRRFSWVRPPVAGPATSGLREHAGRSPG